VIGKKGFIIGFCILILSYIVYPQKTELTFSCGAPLDSYQAKVIIPILTEAFRQNDINLNIESLPSLRSLMFSNGGQTDGELFRVSDFHEITDNQYPNLIKIDFELLTIWLSIFSLNNKTEILRWSDLEGHRIAYYRGRKNVETILRDVPIADEFVFNVLNDTQAFNLLASGRVDFVISESQEGLRLIHENEDFQSIFEVKKMDATKIYSFININHSELIPEIEKTLLKMHLDGTLQSILRSID